MVDSRSRAWRNCGNAALPGAACEIIRSKRLTAAGFRSSGCRETTPLAASKLGAVTNSIKMSCSEAICPTPFRNVYDANVTSMAVPLVRDAR